MNIVRICSHENDRSYIPIAYTLPTFINYAAILDSAINITLSLIVSRAI